MRRRLRFRDEPSLSTGTVVGIVAGALAGITLGVIIAQRSGGFGGLGSKLRRRRQTSRPRNYEADELDFYAADEFDGGDADEALEERVLEAFRNDPLLAERAIDIGSLGASTIELAGWVEHEREAEYAMTIARGVPGVTTVVNRMAIGDEEARYRAASRRFSAGDPALTEARWEGQQVGTGRRRQGTSADVDRHADPRVTLEDRWLDERNALRNAAEDVDGITAERRQRTKSAPKGDRTGGAPVAPTGVPKGDHVAEPVEGDRAD
jgi:hypothetical protein